MQMNNMRLTRARNFIIFSACLGVTSSKVVEAQRQPVVMAHGIRSDASTWDVTAPLLHNRYPVSVRRMTTEWKLDYQAQATTLNALFTTLPESTLAIGHSNGGIVLRQAAVNAAPLRGLLTIGSPNQGAPAANNVRQGRMPSVFSPIGQIGNAIYYAFFNPDPEDSYEQDLIWTAVTQASANFNFWEAVFIFMDFNPSYSIWDSMYPGSSYMLGLNSPASVGTQEAEVPIRGAIVTEIGDPQAAAWRLVYSESDAQQWMAVRDGISVSLFWGAVYLQDKYCYQGWDPNCNNSSLLFDLSVALFAVDFRYCRRIQEINVPDNAPAASCGRSDAVVPYSNQGWSDALAFPLIGVSHVQQTQSPAVRAAIDLWIENQAGLSRCGLGPVYDLSLVGLPAALVPSVPQNLTVHALDRCDWITAGADPVTTASSSDQSVVSVVGTGSDFVTLVGHAPGTASIVVTKNGISRTRSVSVASNSFISAQISSSTPSGSLLPGDEVTLSAIVTSGSPVVSYEWRVNGNAPTSFGETYIHYFAGAATITLTVTNAAGQSASASTYVSSDGTSLRARPSNARSANAIP